MPRSSHPFDARRKIELDLIDKIADRAVHMWADNGFRVERVTFVLDLVSCHYGPQKLRLEALLEADDMNFSHDVAGINRHLDTITGKLNDGFRPRFSWIDQDGNSAGYDRVPAEVRGLV